MRRSRSLSFKKEQEQKFKNMLSVDEQKEQKSERVERVDNKRVDRGERVEKFEYNRNERNNKVPIDTSSKSRIFSDSDTDSDMESDEDVVISKISSQRVQPSQKDNKHTKRQEIYSDEEERVEKVERREEKEEKPTRGRPPKKVETIDPRREEYSDSEHEEERRDDRKDKRRNDRDTRVTKDDVDKRRVDEVDEEDKERSDIRKKNVRMIVSKNTFSKFISASNIDSTSSDIYTHIQQEMVDYIAEVIKIISNNEKDDEVVVKESHLKFIGDKTLAQGILDMKTFEKLYNETKTGHVTFTAEAFKTLCKLTEIHVLEFLKKAKGIMTHCGRKRLNLSDIELLKYILE